MIYSKQRYHIKKTATLKNTLLISVLLGIMHFFIMPEAISQIRQYAPAAGLIDEWLFYHPVKVYEVLDTFNEKGRALYIAFELSADLFYWVVISTLICFLTIWTASKVTIKTVPEKYMILLPLGAMLANILENGGIAWIVFAYPERYFLLVVATSGFALLKWVLLVPCLGLTAWHFLCLGMKQFLSFQF